jgi:hypothetical protein
MTTTKLLLLCHRLLCVVTMRRAYSNTSLGEYASVLMIVPSLLSTSATPVVAPGSKASTIRRLGNCDITDT